MPYALRTCEEEYIELYRAYLYSWLKDIVMYVPTKNKLLANPGSNVVDFYDAPGHDIMLNWYSEYLVPSSHYGHYVAQRC